MFWPLYLAKSIRRNILKKLGSTDRNWEKNFASASFFDQSIGILWQNHIQTYERSGQLFIALGSGQ